MQMQCSAYNALNTPLDPLPARPPPLFQVTGCTAAAGGPGADDADHDADHLLRSSAAAGVGVLKARGSDT